MSDIGDFCIVKTHRNLLTYVDDLQRRNAEALSFYPKQTFEREAENGRIFLGLLNNQPCGYIYIGARGPSVKCHQVAIDYDLRRRYYGMALVAAMEDYAISSNAYNISLRCGFDLAANDFWAAAGYSCVNQVPGGIGRMRTINIWMKQLQDELFPIVAIEPATGKTDASIWRENKQTGIVSRFNRGKRLQDYRSTIINQSKAP